MNVCDIRHILSFFAEKLNQLNKCTVFKTNFPTQLAFVLQVHTI